MRRRNFQVVTPSPGCLRGAGQCAEVYTTSQLELSSAKTTSLNKYGMRLCPPLNISSHQQTAYLRPPMILDYRKAKIMYCHPFAKAKYTR